MARLKLSDIGNIAEAIAAVGVILSLFYVAVQIRQNTQAIRAASYQGLAEGIADFQTILVEDEDFARIYLQALDDPSKLRPEEQLRFDTYIANFFTKVDVAVDLYKRGMIDDKAMIPYTRYVEYMLEQQYIREWWKEGHVFFSGDLRSYIDEHLENE
jgi:hypothetical protein